MSAGAGLGPSIVASDASGTVVSEGDDRRYMIASVSKQFIAASVLMAEQEGVIAVSDLVVGHLPELGRGFADVTLEHLLTHRGGVPHWNRDVPGLWISDRVSQAERIRALAEHGPVSAAGGQWLYSSIGYALLVGIVERATSTEYAAFFDDRLARPAELRSTTVGAPTPGVPTAKGHRHGEPVAEEDLASPVGTGYVWSTADDLARWSRWLHTGPFPHTCREKMLTVHSFPADGQATVAAGYGYGLFVGELGGRPSVFHPGDNPGFTAFAGYFPQDDIALGIVASEEHADVLETAANTIRRLTH